MSALVDRVVSKHYKSVSAVDKCVCGLTLYGNLARHVAAITEVAVREQIAAEITAQTEIDEDQFYMLDSVRNTYLHAARIAGEGTP